MKPCFILYLINIVALNARPFNAVLEAAVKYIIVDKTENTFTKEQFDTHIIYKDAAIKASEIFLNISPELYSVIYPTYIYCEDYTTPNSCLKVGCSWCNWPNQHCQITVIADLYPTTDYCIIHQEISQLTVAPHAA